MRRNLLTVIIVLIIVTAIFVSCEDGPFGLNHYDADKYFFALTYLVGYWHGSSVHGKIYKPHMWENYTNVVRVRVKSDYLIGLAWDDFISRTSNKGIYYNKEME